MVSLDEPGAPVDEPGPMPPLVDPVDEDPIDGPAAVWLSVAVLPAPAGVVIVPLPLLVPVGAVPVPICCPDGELLCP